MTKRSKGPSNSDHHQRGNAERRPDTSEAPFRAHGWDIFLHPLFIEQLERLMTAIERHGKYDSRGLLTPRVKVLNAINSLAFDVIPQDPSRSEYRQGDTLGPHRKHWFRAKLGGGRFRLFFRYRTDLRILVYAWVNDDETLRTYGAHNDAYAVFGRMLDGGNPPNDWELLLEAASSRSAVERAKALGRGAE